MEILTAIYCPYCESRLDIEAMLTLENLKDMQFYIACSECNKTFSAFAKTEIKVIVSSIENRIQGEKEVLLFWEQSEIGYEAFKNERVNIRKERIQELEAIKKKNDKEGK